MIDSGGSERVSFDDFVATYENLVDPLTLPLGIYALDLAQVVRGSRIIDVAAGTGALALVAAKRGAHVLATDVAPNMVARAAERLAPFPDCEARIMDYRSLDAEDQSFDVTLSIIGVLALAEGVAALRELVRVTRPRGCVVVAAWDQDAPAAPQYLAYDVFAESFPGHRLWPNGFFPAWSRNTIAANLREAGCDGVQIHIWEGEWRVSSPENIWDESGPSLSRFPGFQALGAAERQRFAQAFTAAVVRRSDHERVARLTTRACLGIGRTAP